MSNIATDKNKIRLQKSLIDLETWCNTWRVKLNAAKSQLILFNRDRDNSKFSLTLFGNIIKPQKTATLLGFDFDQHMTLKNQISKIQKKVLTRINLLKMLRGRTWGANTHTLLNLYKSYIRPVIEYGSVLTADVSKSNMNKLQILQNKALRVITQRPYDTPIKELQELCNIQMIKDRLIQLKSNSLQRFGNSELMQELVSQNPHFNFPDISS